MTKINNDFLNKKLKHAFQKLQLQSSLFALDFFHLNNKYYCSFKLCPSPITSNTRALPHLIEEFDLVDDYQKQMRRPSMSGAQNTDSQYINLNDKYDFKKVLSLLLMSELSLVQYKDAASLMPLLSASDLIRRVIEETPEYIRADSLYKLVNKKIFEHYIYSMDFSLPFLDHYQNNLHLILTTKNPLPTTTKAELLEIYLNKGVQLLSTPPNAHLLVSYIHQHYPEFSPCTVEYLGKKNLLTPARELFCASPTTHLSQLNLTYLIDRYRLTEDFMKREFVELLQKILLTLETKKNELGLGEENNIKEFGLTTLKTDHYVYIKITDPASSYKSYKNKINLIQSFIEQSLQLLMNETNPKMSTQELLSCAIEKFSIQAHLNCDSTPTSLLCLSNTKKENKI